jgi:hypothetical protein
MSHEEIERILEGSLAASLLPEELEELVRRVRLQEEQAVMLQALPLEAVEPLPSPPVETPP